MALVAERKEDLRVMAMKLAAALEQEDLAIKWEEVHFWSRYRPDSILARRKQFSAEDDLTFLGVIAITGGAAEIDALISRA